MTPKEISLKTAWSEEDEAEFFAAMPRARGERGRMSMLMRRAKAISPNHPHAAIMLYERYLTDYPDPAHFNWAMAIRALASLDAQIGEPQNGAERLRVLTEHYADKQNYFHQELVKYVYYVTEHKCTDHYDYVLKMVPRAEHIRPNPSEKRGINTGSSWAQFCGAAYCAHLLGDKTACADYLEKAKDWYINPVWRAPDTYRLWLFQKAKIGSRSVANVVVRPNFTLAEMHGWAEANWTNFRPDITYNKTDEQERLILAWADFIVDLTLYADPKMGARTVSYFKKKNLGDFDREGARALSWKDAGDYDAPDAINTSIELLDYFKTDPRIAANIG